MKAIDNAKDQPLKHTNKKQFYISNANPILCVHCKRTKDNGIRCLGICVSDNEY